MRDYQPVHVIHEADCPDAPDGLLRVPVSAVRDAHPNARAHSCISFATVKNNLDVVAEPGDAADHAYEPSKVRPEDARRALCEQCGGTHGEVTAQ